MSDKSKNPVARIDNQLVMKAHYNLSTNEQKLVLFLASKVDGKSRTDFNVQRVKITEIQDFLSSEGKRWGSIYERVDMMCNSITDKKITLPKGFVIDGKAIRMNRYIQWFSDIEPYTDDDGEICLKFQFAEPLKDFLLQLSEYVKISMLEVLPMRGKYAIRMYQVFKAERDRTKKYRNQCYLTYGLDELKAMLEIGGKYKEIYNFKARVLSPIKDEINEHSNELLVDYRLLKTRRTITGVEFIIKGKNRPKEEEQKIKPDLTDFKPTEKQVKELTRAKTMAYEMLLSLGVYEGIAYKQILPSIGGSEVVGYEDWFMKEAISHFKKWSKNQSSPALIGGTFVVWWHEKKIFDSSGDVWGKIMESMLNEKKKLLREEPEKYDNREVAKGMTNGEFEEWYKEQKEVVEKE